MLETVTSTRGRVATLMVLFIGAGVVSAASGGEPVTESQSPPRAHLEAVLQDRPATPVLVPREVPDGYELWPSPASSTPGGDPGATWVYRPTDSSSERDPFISVCIVASAGGDREHTCVPEGHEAIAEHDLDGYTAFVVPLGPGADLVDGDPWGELDLTASWQDVDWIDG